MPKKVLGTLTEHLIEHLDEPCLGIDKEGRIHFINQAACRLLDVSEKKAIGVPVWDALVMTDFVRAFARLIKDANPQPREQVVSLGEAGSFLAQMSPAFGTAGRLSGAVAVLRDISGAQRLESDVSNLVTRISQELKVPLTSIKGYVETLLQGAYNEPSVSHRFLKIINEETNRMARILVGLLDVAATPEPAPTASEVNVTRTVRLVVQLLEPLAREQNIVLDVKIAEPVAPVWCNEALLGQAITNLVDNAIKFSKPKSTVLLLVSQEKDNVAIRVQDSGVGIEASEHERIFERFYRSRQGPAAELGGTGLGLSVARDIVQAAGGSLTVQSALGKGSTFILTLPTHVKSA